MASLAGCGESKADEPPADTQPATAPTPNAKPPGLGLLHIRVDDEGRVLRCRFTAHDPDLVPQGMGDETCGRIKGEKVAESIQRAPDSKRDLVVELPVPTIIRVPTLEEFEARRRRAATGS